MHSMFLIGQSLSGSQGVFLVLALGLALAFECVNGFHDTANAVATVIYTHTLRPWIAVVWSGIWNLIGVLFSSGAVAFGIVALLPVELVINVGTGAGFAMVFALLVSAIIWNLGTWYLGLPASSSHTLIGSIMGVGLANSLMSPGHVFGEGVNWAKAGEVGTSLLVSPIVGFVCSALLLLLAKALIRNPALYESPKGTEPPPLWIRGLLMLTCTGVSFAHGSNDGQKGMGLIMLILVGILPGAYALKMTADAPEIQHVAAAAHAVQPVFERLAGGATVSADEAKTELSAYLKTDGKATEKTYAAVAAESVEIATQLDGKSSFGDVAAEERKALRSNIYLAGTSIAKLAKQGKFTDSAEKALFAGYGQELNALKTAANAHAIQNLAASAHAVQPGFKRLAGGAAASADEAKAELTAFVRAGGEATDKTYAAVAAESASIAAQLDGKSSLGDLPADKRDALNSDIYLAGASVTKLAEQGKFTDSKEKKSFTDYGHQLDLLTKFIPDWVKFAVALALGLGTMVGWKRIVVTVGEKIGKSHLTYGQGACAELVAMCTILAADNFGLPVSTTHVLSSGVAGTMAANRSGLQGDTLRNILLAWVLTLPVCVLLGAGLFSFGLYIVFNVLRMH